MPELNDEILITAQTARERSEQFSSDQLNSLYAIVNREILKASELGLTDTRLHVPAEFIVNVIDKLTEKGYSAHKTSPTLLVIKWNDLEDMESEDSVEEGE